MLGFDPKVVVHQVMVKHGVRLIKQAQRRFWLELVSHIEIEIDKLFKVGFIREVRYPTWIVNIILVKKNNGQISVCVDFRDLNNVFLKDELSLPIIELMVDATIGHEALSFMDGSLGYNQIRMTPKDEKLTVFRTQRVFIVTKWCLLD